MIAFAGKRDRHALATTSRCHDNAQPPCRLADMLDPKRLRPASHSDFWSQVPVVAFAAAAVIAIVLVNGRAQPAAAHAAHPPATAEPAPAECGDCGTVIGVRSAARGGADSPRLGNSGALEAQPRDVVHTIEPTAPGAGVGYRVQVEGTSPIRRNERRE